jgi:hypothetical protein
MASAEEKLCEFLNSLDTKLNVNGKEYKKSYPIRIAFKSGSKEMKTEFEITIEFRPIYSLTINNPCIRIDINKTNGSIFSSIEKDSDDLECFTPILQSNNSSVNISKRRTSTDILQVLKTKLLLCMKELEDKEIYLIDEARIKQTIISYYNILRGKNGIYEKYGYKSKLFDELKEKIKKIKWKHINTIPIYKLRTKNITTLDNYFTEIGKEVDENHSIIDIMKKISFEEDNENKISSYVMASILALPHINMNNSTNNIYKDINIVDALKFTLDKESPEWKKWDSDFEITEFEVLSYGGSRNKKTRKHRSKKSKTKSKK